MSEPDTFEWRAGAPDFVIPWLDLPDRHPADQPRDDKVHASIVAPACGLGLLDRERAMATLKNTCIFARSLYDKDSFSLVL